MTQNNERDDAYKCLDRFLRNSLYDKSYSEYSNYLENIYGTPIPQNEQQEAVSEWLEIEISETNTEVCE